MLPPLDDHADPFAAEPGSALEDRRQRTPRRPLGQQLVALQQQDDRLGNRLVC